MKLLPAILGTLLTTLTVSFAQAELVEVPAEAYGQTIKALTESIETFYSGKTVKQVFLTSNKCNSVNIKSALEDATSVKIDEETGIIRIEKTKYPGELFPSQGVTFSEKVKIQFAPGTRNILGIQRTVLKHRPSQAGTFSEPVIQLSNEVTFQCVVQ